MKLPASDGGNENVTFYRAEHVDALIAIIRDYAEHGSWRCDHPPHFYFANKAAAPTDDCPCGLVGSLRAAGLAELAQEFMPRKKTDEQR